MTDNTIISAIRNRRSVRRYKNEPLSDDEVFTVLEAGRWAPSGLNNQPWKFLIIKDPAARNDLSTLTSYGKIVRESPCCIAVFYDRSAGYNRDKDAMAIGACVQNMLLAAGSLGIGSVWLGEILNKKEEFNQRAGIKGEFELMAVIALGYPDEEPQGTRKDLETMILATL